MQCGNQRWAETSEKVSPQTLSFVDVGYLGYSGGKWTECV